MRKITTNLFVYIFELVVVAISCNDHSIPDFEQEIPASNRWVQKFSFLSRNNTSILQYDVECEILEDSIIYCYIPYIVTNKNLIPSFNTTNIQIFYDGNEVVSDLTRLDCSKPVRLELVSGTESRPYILKVECWSGLPIVYIDTESKIAITSKEYYVNGQIKIVNKPNSSSVWESSVRIKGRGNSTWNFPKKPYKLKFNEKTSLLGEPADKEWVLLANYSDKTALRNETAFELSRYSSLEYTPRTHFVDVYINGEYNGFYQLCEQLKISKNRVNVGDDGYLLEIDSRTTSEDVSFMVNHITHPINIKDPEIEACGDAYNYVVKYLQETDSVLFSDNFSDSTNGYAKYIDVTSFVEWYLINEIAKNNDACFFSSCYMNLSRNGKLKMGPVWDFDIGFGNVNYNGCDSPEGFWVKNVAWYNQLFKDPNFVNRVKERFAVFYERREHIISQIDESANYLQYAAIENNGKWPTLYNHVWPNPVVWGSYEDEVRVFKDWLETRFQWLHQKFATM